VAKVCKEIVQVCFALSFQKKEPQTANCIQNLVISQFHERVYGFCHLLGILASQCLGNLDSVNQLNTTMTLKSSIELNARMASMCVCVCVTQCSATLP